MFYQPQWDLLATAASQKDDVLSWKNVSQKVPVACLLFTTKWLLSRVQILPQGRLCPKIFISVNYTDEVSHCSRPVMGPNTVWRESRENHVAASSVHVIDNMARKPARPTEMGAYDCEPVPPFVAHAVIQGATIDHDLSTSADVKSLSHWLNPSRQFAGICTRRGTTGNFWMGIKLPMLKWTLDEQNRPFLDF